MATRCFQKTGILIRDGYMYVMGEKSNPQRIDRNFRKIRLRNISSPTHGRQEDGPGAFAYVYEFVF